MKALLLLLLVAPVRAQTLEGARAGADAAFASVRVVHPSLEEPQEPVLQPPLTPLPFSQTGAGAVVGRAPLATLLESHRHLLTRRFGARDLDLGVGTDAAFSKYWLAFTDAAGTTLAPLGDLNRLRGAGVDARVDASTVYNFKVSINVFSPVRGSTLSMTPAQGTRGAKHDVKTGAVLDAVRARSFPFRAGGREYWLLYGADVRPDGSGYAATRSFLFIKEDGLSSKAWPLAEGALTVDAAASVDLGGLKLVLTKTSSGELVIRE